MGKNMYPFEKVAAFAGLTRQTLCNWCGCNKSYKPKRDKSEAAAGVFIAYHLYGRNRIRAIEGSIDRIEKRLEILSEEHGIDTKADVLEVEKLREEIRTINEIRSLLKEKK